MSPNRTLGELVITGVFYAIVLGFVLRSCGYGAQDF